MASPYEVRPPTPGEFEGEIAAGADEEDDRNLEEIAQAIGDTDLNEQVVGEEEDEDDGEDEGATEMASPTAQGKYTIPSGATPITQNGALSSHAAEFWFPESRDCGCCKGFKHGCRCAKELHMVACKNCASAQPAAANESPVAKGSKSPGKADADDEDERNLAELDTELGGNGGEDGDAADDGDDDDDFDEEIGSEGKRTGLPSGAVPVQQNGRLSEHAAEFWFPECRECTCCKGFKYGCPCTRHKGFLACQDATCKIDTTEKGVKNDKPATPKSARSPSSNAQTMCRFEASQSGCIYGANCRFKHANIGGGGGSGGYAVAAPDYDPNAAAGGYYPQSGSPMYAQPPPLTRATTFPSANGVSDVAICRFFLSGSCMYGENCRYKHGY